MGIGAVVEGFRFLATRKNVRMTFLADLVAMFTAFPRALLPAIGGVILGGDETTVGILLAAMAVGAFLTGLFSGPLTRIHRHGAVVYGAIVASGLSIAGFGVAVWQGQLWPAAALLVLAGAADSVSGIFRNTILQSATPDHLRGRLQGVFVVVVAGGPRVGEMLTGGASTVWGEPLTLIAGGILCVVGVSLLMRAQPAFLRYDARRPVA